MSARNMEWIEISPDKLKIMMSPSDMKRYDLDPDRLDGADEQTRRTFRKIFEDAGRYSGFDAEDKRLFVQLYTSRDGGCEIFVSRLEKNHAVPSPEDALLRRLFDQPDRLAPDTSVTSVALSPLPCRTLAFSFDGLDPLLKACRRLQSTAHTKAPLIQSASVYIDNTAPTRPYYLLLTVADRDFFKLPDAYAFLSEYGERQSPRKLSTYLCEHGTALCKENAVQLLGRL